MSILSYCFERVTGRPWITSVSCTDEYGPTPGAVIAEAFGELPDYTLFHNDHELTAAARRELARRREQQRLVETRAERDLIIAAYRLEAARRSR